MSRRGRGGDDEITIVKRRVKKGHGDAHGGAWKVAFADFTMAMMALFMVLWIVQPQTRHEMPGRSEHLANPILDGGAGIFDGTSAMAVDLGGVPLPGPVEAPEKREGEQEVENPQGARGHAGLGELAELARTLLKLAGDFDALANVEVQVVPQGLRILIRDEGDRHMFRRGSAVLEGRFEELLEALSALLVQVDNKLVISGHTDSTPYAGRSAYDNWNLSGDRALRARLVMVNAGMPPGKVLQVSAQADGMPLLPQDTANGANRRIELLVLTEQAERLYQQLFGINAPRASFGKDGARYLKGVESQPQP